MKKYCRAELEEQRNYILSEFNFHEVMNFCEILNQDTQKPFINYNSIAAIRTELLEVLDRFIHNYLERGTISIYHNNKWEISFSYDYDGETPYLSAAFKYMVFDICAGGSSPSNTTESP